MTSNTTVAIPPTPLCSPPIHASSGDQGRTWEIPPRLEDSITLIEALHTGGEGTVYLVERKRDGAHLALKVYREEFTRLDDQTLERVSEIHHDHVIDLYAFGHDGVWWELMEHCSNGSLRDRLDASGPISPREALSIVREMADVLKAIGERSVVHADLRPANILVRRSSPLDLVLADFGGARILNAAREHRSEGLGTPAYRPPESLTSNTITPAHDYWSLGVIVYEILTGEHPFATDSEAATRYAIDIAPVDLSGIEDIDWRYLIGGLLVSDPDRRWGPDEVDRWLKRDMPDLPKESPFYTTGFQSGGTWFHTPEALARSIAEDWDTAMRLVSGPKTFELLSNWLVSRRDTDASTFIDTMNAVDRGPDYRAAALISFLNPDLPPVFRTHAVGNDQLAGLAASAIKKPSSAAAHDLGDMFRSHLLDAYATSDDRLPAIDDDWHSAVDEFERHIRTAVEHGLPELGPEEMRLARARCLSAVVSKGGPKSQGRWAQRRTQKVASREPWFDQLVSRHGDSVGGKLAVALYVDSVAGRVQQQDETTRADRGRDRERIVQTNRELARASIPRYLTIAVIAAVAAGYLAGELTYAASGGFTQGLIVCGSAVAAAVVIMIATDFLMAMRSTPFDSPPAGRWIYLLTGGLGVLAWWLSAGTWVDQPSPTTLGWVIPPLAIAVGHVFVRAPSETTYGRGRAPWERNVLRYGGLPVGLSLVIAALASLPADFVDRVRYAAELGEPSVFTPDQELLAVVVWALVTGVLISTSGFRESRTAGGRWIISLVAGIAIAVSALYVLVPWETPTSLEMWTISAAWVGTGIQLVVRYHPPRVFWLVVGCIGLGGALHHVAEILPALLDGTPVSGVIFYLTWALASIRLMGVGGEDLI